MLLATLLFACSVPHTLETGAQHGVYEDILERQREGMPIATDTLKDLPELTANDYAWLGDRYYAQEKFSLAYAKYNSALELEPERLDISYKLGLVLLRKKMVEEALATFDQMLSVNSGYALAYQGRGLALLDKGELQDAEFALRLALELDPEMARARETLGLVYDRMGRHDEAAVEYGKALQLKPDDPAVLNNLGMARYLQGEYEASAVAFEKALAAGGTGARIYNNLALSYAKLGRYDQAFAAFSKGGSEASAYNNLGLLYRGDGRLDKAEACFEKALQSSPTFYEAANDNLQAVRKDSGVGGARDLQDNGSILLPCP